MGKISAGLCLITIFYEQQDNMLDQESIFIFCLYQGIARTQSPTNINYAPESSTFGKIAEVNPPGVQWTGLALGEPPSGSGYPLRQVSMLTQGLCCYLLPVHSVK